MMSFAGSARALLNQQPGWNVPWEAATGREAVGAMAKRERPDVNILDLAMPEMNGLEAARQSCMISRRPKS